MSAKQSGKINSYPSQEEIDSIIYASNLMNGLSGKAMSGAGGLL